MSNKVLLNLSDEDRERVIRAVSEFKGHVGVLESALGALIVGQHYGWRVLKIAHGTDTYNKYQRVLGIKFEDVCRERTDISRRSVGLGVADRLNSFWAVVRGRRKVPGKGELA